MNILVSVDKNYIKHLRVLLSSMRSCIPDEKLDVYLLHKSLEEKDLCKLSTDMREKYNISIHTIKIGETAFDGIKLEGHFTIETMLRLVATDVLPDDLDRVLWLDSDIVICNDFSEFYYTDFEGKLIAACAEKVTAYMDHCARLGLNSDHAYFNAGVLLMNLSLLRSYRPVDKYVEILKRYDTLLAYNDQDILNLVYSDGQVKYFDSEKYNFRIPSNFSRTKEEYNQLMNDCCIMHYAARSKPWDVMYSNHVERNYWKYAIRDGRFFEFCIYVVTAPCKTVWMRHRMKQIYGVTYKRLF